MKSASTHSGCSGRSIVKLPRLRVDHRARRLDRAREHGAQIEPLAPQLDLVLRDARDVQQVVGDPHQVQDLALHRGARALRSRPDRRARAASLRSRFGSARAGCGARARASRGTRPCGDRHPCRPISASLRNVRSTHDAHAAVDSAVAVVERLDVVLHVEHASRRRGRSRSRCSPTSGARWRTASAARRPECPGRSAGCGRAARRSAGVSEMLLDCGVFSSGASARLAEMKRHSGSCAMAIGTGARAMIACSECRRRRSSSGLRSSSASVGPQSVMGISTASSQVRRFAHAPAGAQPFGLAWILDRRHEGRDGGLPAASRGRANLPTREPDRLSSSPAPSFQAPRPIRPSVVLPTVRRPPSPGSCR